MEEREYNKIKQHVHVCGLTVFCFCFGANGCCSSHCLRTSILIMSPTQNSTQYQHINKRWSFFLFLFDSWYNVSKMFLCCFLFFNIICKVFPFRQVILSFLNNLYVHMFVYLSTPFFISSLYAN